MRATPQAALISITLPRMSEPLQRRSMTEIMHAANEVFGSENAAIVGGHSTMGAEMSLGFTVTGLCERTPITNAGARPGDALILTRPLGSGVLLAAEMQGAADGRDVAALLRTMATPQGDAAVALRMAHAMTDVTGFGLAGHLLSICRASGVRAELCLDNLPLYNGALELAEEGHFRQSTRQILRPRRWSTRLVPERSFCMTHKPQVACLQQYRKRPLRTSSES